MDLKEIQQIVEILAVLFAIAGVIIYYFGRIIADSKIEEFDKFGSQVEGLFFVLLYVAMPFTFLYFLHKNGLNLLVDPFISEFISFIVVVIIFGLKLSQRIRNLTPTGQKSTIVEAIFTNRVTLMLVASLVLAPATLSFDSVFQTPILILPSLLLGIVGLSLIAIIYGLATVNYPKSEVVLTGGTKQQGKIVKFEKDFVNLVNDNKQIFVMKSQIQYIEQERITTPPQSISTPQPPVSLIANKPENVDVSTEKISEKKSKRASKAASTKKRSKKFKK